MLYVLEVSRILRHLLSLLVVFQNDESFARPGLLRDELILLPWHVVGVVFCAFRLIYLFLGWCFRIESRLDFLKCEVRVIFEVLETLLFA